MERKSNLLTVRTSYSDARIRDFFRFHLTRKGPSRIIFLLLSGVCLIIGIIFIIYARYQTAFFSLFMAVIIWFLRAVMIKTAINSLMKKARPRATHYTLTFAGEDIIYQDDNVKSAYPLTGFEKIYETRNYYYFYLNRNAALTLPKGVLSAEEKEKIENILNRANLKVCSSRFK